MSLDAKRAVVLIATREELQHSVYAIRLWLAARNYPLSRRKFETAIELAIYEFYAKGGVILVPETKMVWKPPVIMEVMGRTGCARWLSIYFEEGEKGKPRRTPSLLTLEKRRLIDLFFRIKHPEMARKFSL